MPNTKRCFCEDWGKWVGDTYVDHLEDGWKFCPWCASPLAESKQENRRMRDEWVEQNHD